jgi:hypothetical protein
MKLNFQFGKKKPDKNQVIIIGVILSIIIASLSQCTGISENRLWDLLDEIQRMHFPQGIINRIILQDPDRVNRRVQRDVDRAIDDVKPEYDRIISDHDKKYKQKYIEEQNDESLCYSDDCKKLGPPMRICSPVFEGIDCPTKTQDK